jgi:hypothetical protein
VEPRVWRMRLGERLGGGASGLAAGRGPASSAVAALDTHRASSKPCADAKPYEPQFCSAPAARPAVLCACCAAGRRREHRAGAAVAAPGAAPGAARTGAPQSCRARQPCVGARGWRRSWCSRDYHYTKCLDSGPGDGDAVHSDGSPATVRQAHVGCAFVRHSHD